MFFSTPISAQSKATGFGLGAILLWGMLALLTAATSGIPPFQLTAMTFAIAGTIGLLVLAVRGQLALLRQPPKAWALGLYGLFGYHAVYFAALKLAPPAEASLIAYFWPLLIVIFAALLLGDKLGPRQLAGGLICLAGVGALALGRSELAFSFQSLPGYILAFLSAFIWASYSVASRHFADVPTEAVAGFCMATAVLAALCHLAFEHTVPLTSGVQWLAVIMLGLGPAGAAFFLWDYAMKKGDIRFLGIASYATPVLSTAALVISGAAAPSAGLFIGCGMIVAGAFMARR